MAKTIPVALRRSITTISHEDLNILEEDIHRLKAVLLRWYNRFHNKLLLLGFRAWFGNVRQIIHNEQSILRATSKAAAKEILQKTQPKKRNEPDIKMLMTFFRAFEYVPPHLGENLFRRFCQEVTWKELKQNEVLFFQGDEENTNYYIVCKGYVCFYSPQTLPGEESLERELYLRKMVGMKCTLSDIGRSVGDLVSTCCENQGFGEAALLARGPRSVTAVGGAAGGTLLISINRGLFDSCLLSMLKHRYRISEKLETLEDLEIFSNWSRNQLIQLCCNLAEVEVTQGNLLVKEGVPVEHVYMVASGQVAISTKMKKNLNLLVEYELLEQRHVGMAATNDLCLMGRGSLVGDVEVLQKRMICLHTVRAVTDVRFYKMTPNAFNRFLVNLMPQTFETMEKALKLRATMIKKTLKEAKRKKHTKKAKSLKSIDQTVSSRSSMDSFKQVADIIMESQKKVSFPSVKTIEQVRKLKKYQKEENPSDHANESAAAANDSEKQRKCTELENIQPIPQFCSKTYMLKGRRIKKINLNSGRPATMLGIPQQNGRRPLSPASYRAFRPATPPLPTLRPDTTEDGKRLLLKSNSMMDLDAQSVSSQTSSLYLETERSYFTLQSQSSFSPSCNTVGSPASTTGQAFSPKLSPKPAPSKILSTCEKQTIVARLEGQYQARNTVRKSATPLLNSTPLPGSYYPAHWKNYNIMIKRGPIGYGSSKEVLSEI